MRGCSLRLRWKSVEKKYIHITVESLHYKNDPRRCWSGQDGARAHSKHGHLGILWTGAEGQQEALQARLQYMQYDSRLEFVMSQCLHSGQSVEMGQYQPSKNLLATW